MAATVSWSSLQREFARLRADLVDRGLSPARFDLALEEFERLPRDAAGDFCLPPGTAVPLDTSVPPPSSMAASCDSSQEKFALESLGVEELSKAVACGALRSVFGRAAARRFHRLFAVWRSSSVRNRARLIADLRPLNRVVGVPPSFSLPSFLQVAVGACLPSHAAKVDLVSAFWSLRMSEWASMQMSTSVTPFGLLQWKGMPMGYCGAPHLFHVALLPFTAWLESRGVRVIRYLDDFLVLGDEAEVADGLALLKGELSRLGFSVSEEKSSSAPVRDIVFLGMGVDLESSSFYWPKDKAESVSELARSMLSVRRVQSRDLSRLLGKLAFLCQVCPLAAVWRRSLDSLLAAETFSVTLCEDSKAELRFWVNSAVLLRHTFPFSWGPQRYVVRTDASETGGGIRIQFADGTWRAYSTLLPRDLRGSSSTARELHVSVQALYTLSSVVGLTRLIRARVDLYSDSQSGVATLRGGARGSEMVAFGRRALEWVRSTGVGRFDPQWVRRDLLTEEDLLSRIAAGDLSQSAIVPGILGAVTRCAFGCSPALDLFATAANARAPAWVSAVPEEGAVTVDGLAATVVPCTWAFPPFSLAPLALSKVERQPCSALVCVPDVGPLQHESWVRIEVVAPFPILPPPDFGHAIASSVPLAVYAWRCDLPVLGGRLSYMVGDPDSLEQSMWALLRWELVGDEVPVLHRAWQRALRGGLRLAVTMPMGATGVCGRLVRAMSGSCEVEASVCLW